MKHLIAIFFPGLLAALFSGCSNLKPATAAPRYFMLGPAQTPETGTGTNSTSTSLGSSQRPGPAIGVAPIKFPDYLTKKSVAIRKSANEIEYLESANWAERLEEGFLRVLTANLAGRLPGRTVRSTSSRKERVDLELQLSILQFDVNTTGKGVLSADWRFVSLKSGETIGEGHFHFSREGANPYQDPGGVVSTLRALIDDLGGALSNEFR